MRRPAGRPLHLLEGGEVPQEQTVRFGGRGAQLLPGTLDTGGASGLIISNVTGYTPTFDVGPMEEQEVDPDRVEAIRNARL